MSQTFDRIQFTEQFFGKLAEPLEASGPISSGLEQDTSGERDRDSGTRGGERRGAVMNPKKFLASHITTISVEGLIPERVFMIDTYAEPNLIKARNVHPDTQILREDKLHTVDVTDGFVESLGSILTHSHSLRMNVVPDNFQIPQEEILETDFLKDNLNTYPVRCTGIRKMAWHNNPMYKTGCCPNSGQNGILYQNEKVS